MYTLTSLPFVLTRLVSKKNTDINFPKFKYIKMNDYSQAALELVGTDVRTTLGESSANVY